MAIVRASHIDGSGFQVSQETCRHVFSRSNPCLLISAPQPILCSNYRLLLPRYLASVSKLLAESLGHMSPPSMNTCGSDRTPLNRTETDSNDESHQTLSSEELRRWPNAMAQRPQIRRPLEPIVRSPLSARACWHASSATILTIIESTSSRTR